MLKNYSESQLKTNHYKFITLALKNVDLKSFCDNILKVQQKMNESLSIRYVDICNKLIVSIIV